MRMKTNVREINFLNKPKSLQGIINLYCYVRRIYKGGKKRS